MFHPASTCTCRNLLHGFRHLQQLTTHAVNLEIDLKVLKCWCIFAEFSCCFEAFVEVMHLKDSVGVSFCRHSAGISYCRRLQAVEGTCRNLLHCCRHLQQLTTNAVNLETDLKLLKCWYIFEDMDFCLQFSLKM